MIPETISSAATHAKGKQPDLTSLDMNRINVAVRLVEARIRRERREGSAIFADQLSTVKCADWASSDQYE